MKDKPVREQGEINFLMVMVFLKSCTRFDETVMKENTNFQFECGTCHL